jgi:hypothetical protein
VNLDSNQDDYFFMFNVPHQSQFLADNSTNLPLLCGRYPFKIHPYAVVTQVTRHSSSPDSKTAEMPVDHKSVVCCCNRQLEDRV